jgi:dihydrofolate reductase
LVNQQSGAVVIEMSMSLDGFVAGPDDSMEHRLGTRGGEHVFDWLSSGSQPFPIGKRLPLRPEGASRGVIAESYERFGAYVAGRRTYELAEGWGGLHPVGVPTFVLTHTPDPNPPGDGTGLIFATDGIEEAIRQARETAKGKDVALLGASPSQQALKAGLVDEIYVHVAPILIGEGVRLFESFGDREIELQQIDAFAGPGVAHLRYQVRKR